MKKFEEKTEVSYEVHFGQERMKDRKVQRFQDEDAAEALFLKKQSENMHVDVVKVTTVTAITREMMTSPNPSGAPVKKSRRP